MYLFIIIFNPRGDIYIFKKTLKKHSLFRSCVRVEVAVLGCPS